MCVTKHDSAVMQVRAEECNFLEEAVSHRGKSEPIFYMYRVRLIFPGPVFDDKAFPS